jgi:hypothetical protein
VDATLLPSSQLLAVTVIGNPGQKSDSQVPVSQLSRESHDSARLAVPGRGYLLVGSTKSPRS